MAITTENVLKFIQSLSEDIIVSDEDIFNGSKRPIVHAYCFMLLQQPVFVKPKKCREFQKAAKAFSPDMALYIAQLCVKREKKAMWDKNIIWRKIDNYDPDKHQSFHEYLAKLQG